MDQQLLEYYNQELLYIRELGGEFAKEYPKIAGRLGLDGFECADPYVERLLEGFAFMAARIHLKMDAEFPKFTDHLLEMVFPQYLASTPSMAVVQFQPDFEVGSLAEGYLIGRDTNLRSVLPPNEQTPCTYRTAHDVTLWPIELLEARYVSRDAVASRLPAKFQRARAIICLRFATTAEITFQQLGLDNLPIYLRGKDVRAFRLYEQLFTDALGVLVSSVGSKSNDARSSSSTFELTQPIATLGFEQNQALFPQCPQTFDGYRLLSELFAFQQRFLFFELQGLRRAISQIPAKEIEVLIPLRRLDESLENIVDESSFGLFCTPAINLFPMRADRVHLSQNEVEFHIVPDRTRPMDFEPHTVLKVNGYDAQQDKPYAFSPFYRIDDEALNAKNDSQLYYTLRRTFRQLSVKQKRRGPRTSYIGSETYISIVDANNAPYSTDLEQLDLHLLCTNRDLPLTMPIGKLHTDFTVEDGAPVKSIRCVAGPSEPRASLSSLSGDRNWRLISHLTLNYLSILGKEGKGAAALRELLTLYQDNSDPDLIRQVNSLTSVDSQPIVRRLSQRGPLSFGRGIEITIECDESLMEGSSAFLFGSVMSHFFSKYASINSFVQTVLRTKARGEVMRWPIRIGSRQIL
jgi:type VI secretion system protein ImpG